MKLSSAARKAQEEKTPKSGRAPLLCGGREVKKGGEKKGAASSSSKVAPGGGGGGREGKAKTMKIDILGGSRRAGVTNYGGGLF